MAGTSGGYYNSRCSLPSAWETRVTGIRNQSAIQYLKVDGLRVRYVGPGEDDTQAATIRSNYPLPADVPLFYFEVTVLDRGQEGYIGVGLCTDSVLLTRLPGWDPHSYGYHADDGHAFAGSGTGRPYGPGYGVGDVIGVLYDRSSRTISYFKNGLPLGPAFPDVAESAPLYPCVGLRTRGEEVVVNFGSAGPSAEPFRTDLAALRATFQRHVLSSIRNTKLPLLATPTPAPAAPPPSFGAAASSPSPLAASPSPATTSAAGLTGAAAAGAATASAAGTGSSTAASVVGSSSRPLLPHLLYDYLVHQRYAGTAAAVARDMLRGQPALGEAELSDMRLRGAVSEAVAGGDVDGALELLQLHTQYAQVLADRPSLDFRLRLQRFVEMVGAATTAAAAAAAAGESAAAAGSAGPGAGANGSASGSAATAAAAMEVSSASAPTPTSTPAAAPHVTNGATSSAAAAAGTATAVAHRGGVASTSAGATGEGAVTAGGSGQAPTTRDILAYGTQELWGRCRTPADRDLLTDALSLLAFHDPAASPAGYLLRPAHRAALAEELDGALLAAAGRPPHSALERLFQQAACCVAELKRGDHPQALALPDPRVLVLEPPPALSAALAAPPGNLAAEVGAGSAGAGAAAAASGTESMSM
ncbi:hypothetical protein CHLRE_01g007150v5 [Chlamydomonas reinhardtii]|uniref:B30.2/SPRY domain-containing protein n=1 Tax=Chlamydomonas reinhardtii TaxID=3055 RepID=A0A2K3E596_CHLRE|nr:uncharacterized protein CHLRE_01g007150v5 [Chlamydomonas reinhardtii]PNW87923.1 hypothetical protein CHLRE_01g007150v5 [Chlamydomonas reinhardtii]